MALKKGHFRTIIFNSPMKNDGWVRGYVKLQVCILDLGGVPKNIGNNFQIIKENLLAKQWANTSQQIGNSQTINFAASRKRNSTNVDLLVMIKLFL